MAEMDLGTAFMAPQTAAQNFDQSAEQEPYKLAHMQSLARLQNAQAGTAEMALDANRQMVALMRARGGMDPTKPASVNLLNLAGDAAQAGNLTAAKDITLRSAQAQSAEARTAAANARLFGEQVKASSAKADYISNLAAAVRQQPDPQRAWALGMMQYGQRFPDEPIDPHMMQYDPERMNLLADQALKEKDRLHAQYEETVAAERERNDRARVGAQYARTAVMKYGIETRAETAAARAKVGGKDAGMPTAAERTDAMTILKNDRDLAGQLGDEDKLAFATDLAANARALYKESKGAMSLAEARQRTLTAMKTSGAFVPGVSGLFGDSKGSYSPAGLKPETAIALSTIPDAKDLKEGKYYTFNGRTGIAKGGKIYPVAAGRARAVAPPPPRDEGEGDGSDEEED